MHHHMSAENASVTAAEQEEVCTQEIQVRSGAVPIRQELQFAFGEAVQQPKVKHTKHLCSQTASHFQHQLHSHLGVNATAACW